MKRIIYLLMSFFLFSSFVLAENVSTDTVVAEKIEQKTAVKTQNLEKALFELNEKYESLWDKYVTLSNEFEELQVSSQKQNRLLLKQSLEQTDPERVKDIETSLGLIRSELTQIREDIGILKSEIDNKGTVSGKKWYKSKWVIISSFGASLLALLVAL
ncbi:MAG: hypothetical protein JW871_06365 [Endomicrobiales bacterium]|nr:hypothetical protein [Endomicrobiales bacterium]